MDQSIDAEESNYKMYNRRHLLYCQAEKAAANHCFTTETPDKPMWSNKTSGLLRGIVLRFLMDPAVSRRMPLEKFAFHEKELRQKVLTGLRDDKWKTWDDGFDHLEIKQYIMMNFKLEDPPAKAPPQTPNAPKPKGKGNEYSPIKTAPALPQVHPYGGGKGSKGGGKGKGDMTKDIIAKDGLHIIKDAASGQGYCYEWNGNRPCKCDNKMKSASCPFLNVCNFVKCANRKNCKGAWWHAQNPGKGVTK